MAEATCSHLSTHPEMHEVSKVIQLDFSVSESGVVSLSEQRANLRENGQKCISSAVVFCFCPARLNPRMTVMSEAQL